VGEVLGCRSYLNVWGGFGVDRWSGERVDATMGNDAFGRFGRVAEGRIDAGGERGMGGRCGDPSELRPKSTGVIDRGEATPSSVPWSGAGAGMMEYGRGLTAGIMEYGRGYN
jgi:hypothetical protein